MNRNIIPIPTGIVRNLTPYVPGEQPQGGGIIKLNTNENPYPPAPEVIEAIRGADLVRMKLYPDPMCRELRGLLAEKHGAEPEEIFVGNGSDEVLRLLFQAYLEPTDTLAMVEPTYSLYPVIAATLGAKTHVYDLGAEGDIPALPGLADSKIFVIASPNPPLGTFYPADELGRLAASAPSTLFIIDEAYVDFARGDATGLVKQYGNVVICRTFSKSYSLAGMRIGYACGSREIIGNLNRIKDSYNVNFLSQKAACAGVRAGQYYREAAARIRRDREFLTDGLRRQGFRVYNSEGNFIFAENGDGRALYEYLKAKNILVRYFNTPRLSGGVRITIGTREELTALIDAVKAM